MASYVVASTDELPEGQRKLVKIRGREIALFNLKGEYFAILNKCPHFGASLVCGVLVGAVKSAEPGQYSYSRDKEFLRCPWHGWEYDVRTGQSWCDPDDYKVKSYPTTVVPGERVVKGPYVAETFKVSIDDHYVIVDV